MTPPLDGIAPRSSSKNPTSPAAILDGGGDLGRLEEAVNKEGGRATLRLKKDGQATVEEVVCVCVFLPFVLIFH